ncbi:---NA--- [Paramuricea clavata]|uniref:---NA n=1 Tax=Paramuricea clavata TaxID=317549 RepID=A0A6S7HWG4_PARCT|nr:---NA--- [Paramuricea clavata]
MDESVKIPTNNMENKIILKWTGQTRKKLIIEKDSEVNLVANTLKRLCNGDLICLDTATACKESIDNKAKQSVAADSEFSTMWAAINRIQDVVTAKLDEVTLAHDNKLIRIEAEVCKARSNNERKIENLNNKCHDLLLKLEYNKALEDKVNKLEVLVGNLKADMQDLRNENGLFKSKPRLFKNSTPKVQQKNTGNNDLYLINTINIPDEPITIVQQQPQDLNKNLELNTSLLVGNKASRANKGSVYNPQMNSVIECIEARNQPRTDPPKGPHTSKATKRNSAISSKPLPRHLVPCPFLRRRGFCLKGPLCDFQHKNSQSSNNPLNNPSYCSSNNRPRVSNNLQRYPHNLGYTSYPNISQPITNHFPFPVSSSHYFPPFQPPQYHPMLRPYVYPPPLLTSI